MKDQKSGELGIFHNKFRKNATRVFIPKLSSFMPSCGHRFYFCDFSHLTIAAPPITGALPNVTSNTLVCAESLQARCSVLGRC